MTEYQITASSVALNVQSVYQRRSAQNVWEIGLVHLVAVRLVITMTKYPLIVNNVIGLVLSALIVHIAHHA